MVKKLIPYNSSIKLKQNRRVVKLKERGGKGVSFNTCLDFIVNNFFVF